MFTTLRTLLVLGGLLVLAEHLHGLPGEVLLALAADLLLQLLRQVLTTVRGKAFISSKMHSVRSWFAGLARGLWSPLKRWRRGGHSVE